MASVASEASVRRQAASGATGLAKNLIKPAVAAAEPEVDVHTLWQGSKRRLCGQGRMQAVQEGEGGGEELAFVGWRQEALECGNNAG